MKPSTKRWIAVASAPVIAATIFASYVINYNKPYYSREDLAMAQHHLETAYYDYDEARNILWEQSRDTLNSDKQYLDLTKRARSMYAKMDNQDLTSDEYINALRQGDELSARADSLSDELRNEYMLRRTSELDFISSRINSLATDVEKMQRDSTICDSLSRVPVTKRFKDNWRQIRLNHNQQELAKHQQIINELTRQKTK